MTRLGVLLATAMLLMAGSAYAADVRTYQVTGPVVSATDTAITVKKGTENWEIAKGPDTKGAADAKVGDKVTVTYRMTAASIEVKSAGAKGAKKK